MVSRVERLLKSYHLPVTLVNRKNTQYKHIIVKPVYS